jgi:Uncharacterized protein SCO1/SenC/PrrC, involved in biogenesis of respiratory and photosynthetic systems
MSTYLRLGIVVALFSFLSCQFIACMPSTPLNPLPILGERQIVERNMDDVKVIDTIYHTIPDFTLVDQDSNIVSKNTLKGKIYLADFFFTRCPTICPVTSRNLLQVAKHFVNEPRVVILSHTVDPTYDKPYVLKRYAAELGAPSNWLFLNGPKVSVYKLAGAGGYFSFAQEDPNAPGGFDHSGAFILVDTAFRVRAAYDGTKTDSIPKIIADIQHLLNKG